jgi:hypothetical protein
MLGIGERLPSRSGMSAASTTRRWSWTARAT